MSRPIAEKQLAAIRGVIERAADGCAFGDIAGALNPRPPRRNLQRWLSALVREKQIVRSGTRRTTRYRLPQAGESVGDGDGDAEPLPIRRESAAHAIQILVTRPLAERPPVGYRRAWLDAYEPNTTWYLSDEVRGQLMNAPGVQGGAQGLQEPITGAIFLVDITYAGLVLEGERVTADIVRQFLIPGRSAEGVSRAQRLALNHRSAVGELKAGIGALPLTAEAVLNLADWMDSQIIRNENGNPVGDSAVRIGPLTMPGSAYQPPAGDATLRATFEQLVATAAAIKDPFEQSFFLFVHLLYLQPFNFNFATACLAANLPLLNAKLLPIAFATVPVRDFRAGVLGVCELNRLELIRQVFLQAYFDRLELPDGHPWKR